MTDLFMPLAFVFFRNVQNKTHGDKEDGISERIPFKIRSGEGFHIGAAQDEKVVRRIRIRQEVAVFPFEYRQRSQEQPDARAERHKEIAELQTDEILHSHNRQRGNEKAEAGVPKKSKRERLLRIVYGWGEQGRYCARQKNADVEQQKKLHQHDHDDRQFAPKNDRVALRRRVYLLPGVVSEFNLRDEARSQNDAHRQQKQRHELPALPCEALPKFGRGALRCRFFPIHHAAGEKDDRYKKSADNNEPGSEAAPRFEPFALKTVNEREGHINWYW